MYSVLIVILLILFFLLVKFSLKSTTKGIKFLIILSGISILSISSLVIFSEYYKEINPFALIITLIIMFGSAMFYAVRRLH